MDIDNQDQAPSDSRWMWYAFGVAALVVGGFLVAGGSSGANQDDGSGVDDVLAIPFATTDGSTATLDDYRGEPLVVNFFASWCPPCRAELPDFESTHLANLDDVTFIGINHDLDKATWRAFVAESDITYDTGFQPQTEIWTELGALGMPTTAFISADGEVVKLHTGILSADGLQELIDLHLLEKA